MNGRTCLDYANVKSSSFKHSTNATVCILHSHYSNAPVIGYTLTSEGATGFSGYISPIAVDSLCLCSRWFKFGDRECDDDKNEQMSL